MSIYVDVIKDHVASTLGIWMIPYSTIYCLMNYTTASHRHYYNWPLHCVTSMLLLRSKNNFTISEHHCICMTKWMEPCYHNTFLPTSRVDLYWPCASMSLLDRQLKQGYWYSKQKEAENSTVNFLSNSLQIRRKQDYYSFLHYCQPKEHHKSHRSIGFAKACTIFCSRSSSSIHAPLCCLIISLSLCRLSSTFKSFCFRYNRLSAVSFAW